MGGFGSGKTHLMSAFAKQIYNKLLYSYKARVLDFIVSAIKEAEKYYNKKEGMFVMGEAGIKEMVERISHEKFIGAPNDYTEVAFATFNELYDRRADQAFVQDFLSRRIIIVDDIYHKNDKVRMDFIEMAVDERYNGARGNTTFFTSNASPKELTNMEGYPEKTSGRIFSRLQEMCFSIEFKAGDYRQKKAEEIGSRTLDLLGRLRQK